MAEGARITIDAQLQFRHDVEANWLAADPILKVGEPAYTIGYSDRFKLGDGQSKWSELPYLQLGEGGGGGGSQAYESLAWSAIKTLTSGDASVLAQAYAVKQAYNELKSLIPNLADYYTKEQINALIPSLAGYATEAWVLSKGYATESFVNTKIADLINGAPTTLDTLKEIADAFAASQDVIEALDEAIGKKANQSDLTALAARVAANEGNITSLSSNKLDKSIWDSVFEIDAKGNLRAKVGIYSTSFISARTSDPSAGGGGEGGGGAFSLYTWDQVKAMTAEVGGVAPTAYALKQAYNELINATPTLSWNNIQDKPIFATVATSGSYSDLIGRPTALSDLANDVGYITASAIPTSYAWSAITGKPSFATVATSGSYNDLSNKPSIPSIAGLASESWVTSNFLGLGGGTITGNLNIGYNKLYIGDGSDNFYIGWGGSNMFAYNNYFGHYFATNGAEQMRITQSGNVLIGTTTDNGAKLQVNGLANFTSIYTPNANTFNRWCNSYNSYEITQMSNITEGAPSGYPYGYLTTYRWNNGSWSGQMYLTVADFGGEIFTRGFRDDQGKWTIWRKAFLDDGYGNFTTSESVKVNNIEYLNLRGFKSNNSESVFGFHDNAPIILSHNGVIRFGITDYNSNVWYQFNWDYSTKNLTIKPSEGTNMTTNFTGNITANGTIYSAVGMYSPGYISARSTAGSSDRNLKTNIAPIRNALAYILGTNYVSFDWKDTGEHSVGIIAQEELIREWSCLVQKYSEHYSYQYTQHTALIGSALQEEDKKVEDLKAEVVTLKNRVQKLERQLWQQ
jgi:hypothetical protein